MAYIESSEKTWVWVPDDIEGYLSGWVKSEKDDMVEVVLDSGRGVCSLFLINFHRFSPQKLDPTVTRIQLVQEESSQVR